MPRSPRIIQKSVTFFVSPFNRNANNEEEVCRQIGSSFSGSQLEVPSLSPSCSRRSSSPRAPPKRVESDTTLDTYHTICVGNITNFNTSIPGSQNRDWMSLEESILDLFNKSEDSTCSILPSGKLSQLHEHVKNLLDSNIGSFVYDRFQSRMLVRGMEILRDKLKKQTDLLHSLCETWELFFTEILPTLDCILYRVKPKNALTIRQTTLVAFRDEILLKIDLEKQLEDVLNDRELEEEASQLRHMLLILQSVNEHYPPSKNKLQLEALTARIVDPYLGYRGLYLNGKLAIPSNEPLSNARRKSIDPMARRISRPFSLQPKGIESLQELFENAVRKQN